MNDQATMMNQQQQPQLMNMNQNMMSMNQMNPQPQPQMVPMNRGYGMWAPPPPPQFQNPNPGAMIPPPPSGFNKQLGPRSNWKGKKLNKTNDKRRKDLPKSLMAGSSNGGNAGGVNMIGGRGVGNTNFISYQPPTLNELQQQNRLRARKFFPKKFNKNNAMNMNMNMGGNINNNNNNNNRRYNNRSAPYAPRNTTSFIIRAKKSGGIAPLVTPSPMTPAVLPTPIFSPSKEVLVDMAKEEWGVDGYGSMKGLIRLRSPGHELEPHEDEEEEDEGGSSESDVEEHVEVERRLDHDLSRFEMIYNPNNVGGMDYPNVLENRVDDQDSHIAQLEEENLTLKERLFLMERELGDLRRRMQFLERKVNKEVVENDSENESGSRGEEAQSMEDNNEGISEDNGCSKGKSDDGHNAESCEEEESTEKSVLLDVVKEVENNDDGLVEAGMDGNATCVEGKVESDGEQFMDMNKTGGNSEVVEDVKENNNDDENKHEGLEVKVEDDVETGLSEAVLVAGDVCMEDVGVAKDDMVSQKDVAN